MVFRAPDGRYMIVTSDAMEGGEGKYRVGFSETSEYDGEHIKVAGKSVTLADIKQGLAGLADGSLVIGENRLESATTRENAPVLNEGVVRRQATAQSANEAQRAENGGVSIVENASRHAIELENKSIKDQMREHLDELSAMDPVAKISYERLPNKEKLRQKLVEEFSKYGTQVDREAFGAIQISKEEISTGLNYVYTDAEYAAFFAVPKILKRGIVISGHPDHKGRSYGTITIAAPIEINGQRVIVGVVVKQAGKNRYKTHRVLLPDGKELRGDNEKNTGSTVARHALQKEDQRSAINPVSNTSIPQNTEKSTDSEKKVAEVDGSNRSALPRTRARGDKTRAQVKAEKKASVSAAERIAEEMRTENGRDVTETGRFQASGSYEGKTETNMPSRGYTDAEANEARGLVKDFDLLPHSVRRSIVELIRSGKTSGASKNFLRHSANLIAYWRRGLWVIADDKTRDDGFYTTFTDGSRLIVVKPNREAKAVSETLMHELGHDVWARADAATRKVLYELATEGVKQEEIDAIRERYREELTKRGEIPENVRGQSEAATTESESNGRSPHPPQRRSPFPAGEGKEMTKAEVEALLDEEVATNLIGEIIGKEEFLKRFDGTETSAIKRILRTLSNMKKRFTGKDKYLYRKADDLFKAFTRVMAMEEVGAQSGGTRTRHSINRLPDGTKYVRLDGNIFLKPDGTEMAPVEAYNALVGKKIVLEDGDVITFIKRLPKLNIYYELFKKMPSYEDGIDVKAVSEKINKNMVDVVEGSSVMIRNEAQRHPHIGIKDFDQREVYLFDGNQSYRIELCIANLTDGTKIAYVKRRIEEASPEIDEKIKKAEAAWQTHLNQPSTTIVAEKSKKSTDSSKKVLENAGANRSALPKRVESLSGDEMIENAMARGTGQKSQTSAKTEKKPTKKPKKTAAQVARENAERKAAVEMAQVEEKAARAVKRAQRSAENAVKNAETLAAQKIARTEEQAARRVRNAEKSAENAKKNAEKALAAEKARLEREQSETIKRNFREIAGCYLNCDKKSRRQCRRL